METNVGGIDKIIRIIIGLAIIVYIGLVLQSWWGLIGIIPLMTGLVSRCILYYPFGINTCKKQK
jgi:hypothetical protein